MVKMCIACGMPMDKSEDFPEGDESKDYCVHCAREDGTMKSYDEVLNGMTQFIVQSQGLDREVANTMAVKMMAKLPTWKEEK